MMATMQSSGGRKAFTLIEVLVVIGIIAVLIAILVPTVQSAIARGQKVQAQGDTRRLLAGWKSFYSEYGRWPTEAREGTDTGMAMNAQFVGILTTRYYEQLNDNPKRIKFMEIVADQISTNGMMVDPWGVAYHFLVDSNFNGRVERSGFGDVHDNIAIWSSGPDTLSSKPEESLDDIKSWE